ncbi:ParA family protein [Enterococcus sp. N249-2]
MAKKLAMIQNKGGSGKTTTTVNLIGALSVTEPDAKIALVGVDGQGNAASAFGIDPNSLENTMYDVFMGNCDVEEVIIHNVLDRNIDIIPSNKDMNFLEFDDMARKEKIKDNRTYDFIQSFSSNPAGLLDLSKEELSSILNVGNTSENYFNMLQGKFDKIDKEYDYILFDTPPEIKSVTSSVISIADSVIIPFDPDVQSLEGIINILPRIQSLKTEYNPNLQIAGILATQIRSTIRLHAQLTKQVMMFCMQNGINYFETEIPMSSKFASIAANTGLPGTLVEADDKFIKSYYDLLSELKQKNVL